MAVKLKKSISDTFLFYMPKKKSGEDKSTIEKNTRCLIIVNVLGSAGPLRFVANEKDSVFEVIETALKLYGREKRLPVLGYDVNGFLLYLANAGLNALSLNETIGSQGLRTFVLCKKERRPQMTEARSEMVSKKKGNSFKTWITKSFSFNISPSSTSSPETDPHTRLGDRHLSRV